MLRFRPTASLCCMPDGRPRCQTCWENIMEKPNPGVCFFEFHVHIFIVIVHSHFEMEMNMWCTPVLDKAMGDGSLDLQTVLWITSFDRSQGLLDAFRVVRPGASRVGPVWSVTYFPSANKQGALHMVCEVPLKLQSTASCSPSISQFQAVRASSMAQYDCNLGVKESHVREICRLLYHTAWSLMRVWPVLVLNATQASHGFGWSNVKKKTWSDMKWHEDIHEVKWYQVPGGAFLPSPTRSSVSSSTNRSSLRLSGQDLIRTGVSKHIISYYTLQ